jgi:type IV secretion system protein VirD4
MPRSRASGPIAVACRLMFVAALLFAGYGVGLAACRFPVAAVILLAAVTWRRSRRRQETNAHGSARVASLCEMENAGLLADDGVLLGRALPEATSLPATTAALLSPSVRSETACRRFLASTYSKRWNSERLIRTNNHINLAAFAPTGASKGTAVMIPNLLSYRGNCVNVDVKGELYFAAAQHRLEKFGKKSYRLDPFGVCGPGGDTLNPFDFLDHQKPDFLDRCRAFANPLIIRPADEKQPHFSDMAEGMLVALSAFVCGCQPDRGRRHLGTARHCASSRQLFSQAVELMRKTDACHGLIRRQAGELTFAGEEEQGSIFTTFSRNTQFLDSPLVAHNVASSSFDPMELKTGNADVYLILPHDMLVSHNRLMRLWINTILSRVTSGAPDESRKVLWLLDEMAHIGRMQVIENAATLYRGYGMRFFFVFQSLAQLKTTFADKASTILDNIGTQQYFGINSFETAEEISKRIGTATVGTKSGNSSTSSSRQVGNAKEQGANVSSSDGVTYNEIARRLYLPEEILTLPSDMMLIFHKNLPVIPARLVKYFEAPEFRKGGIGASRRLGLVAAMLAGFTLYVGMLLAEAGAMVAAMPEVTWRPSRRPQAMARGGTSAARRLQPGSRFLQAPPNRQQARRRRPGPSGDLIKID